MRRSRSKGFNSVLVVEQVFLDTIEELFGLLECQAQLLKASVVFFQGDNIGDGFFLAIIAAYDKLTFGAHGEAPPG
jgi:hypothetical protein